jgi:hypothetical protein
MNALENLPSLILSIVTIKIKLIQDRVFSRKIKL